MKKLLIIIFILILSFPASAQFLDIPKDDPLYEVIKLLADEKIVKPGGNLQFKPNAQISRYEMSVMLYRTIRKTIIISSPAESTMRNNFKDVGKKNFAYESVSKLFKAGIISKPPRGYFNGDEKVSRYEFYSAFEKAIKKLSIFKEDNNSKVEMYQDISFNHWAYQPILFLIEQGYLPPPENKQDFFGGGQTVTRKEAAVVLYLAIKKMSEEKLPAQIITPEAEKIIKVPETHYAYSDIAELLEAKILSPSAAKGFRGDQSADRYDAMELLAGVLEKILAGEGELKPAVYDLKYKDVSVLHPAYPPIQKLIELGILPVGNNRELFYGRKKITRYQMIYIFFNPLEDALAGTLAFEKADSSKMYKDVNINNPGYPIIQKLIWLGALEGGWVNKFEGSRSATRYEMAHFVSKLLKSISLKIKGKGAAAVQVPSKYGFDLYLTTTGNILQRTNGKAGGGDLRSATAAQAASFAFSRNLGNDLGGYLNIGASYTFGQRTGVYPQLSQGYLVINKDPFIVQAGRFAYFESYDPFGNSLFADSLSDMIRMDYENDYGKASLLIGKLINLGNDLSFDSNAATFHLTPNISFFGPAELSVGMGYVTNPLDPSGLIAGGQLGASITQSYAGARVPLTENFELNAEAAAVSYTNEDAVLPFIGFSPEVDKSAVQSALTYYSSNMNYQVSIGYQKIGDDYYLAQLVDPVVLVGGGQGTASWLFKLRNYFPNRDYMGLDVENISRSGQNETNRYTILYNRKFIDRAYLRFSLQRTEDKTVLRRDSWNLSGQLSVYF